MQLKDNSSFFECIDENKNSHILIEANVVSSLLQFIQNDQSKPESGGCLLGFFRGDHIHITEITSPQPLDIQTRYSFQRLDPKHTKLINDFISSNTNGSYIGEWHTHPQYTASPSALDQREWKKIQLLRQPTKSCFIIVGKSTSYYKIL